MEPSIWRLSAVLPDESTNIASRTRLELHTCNFKPTSPKLGFCYDSSSQNEVDVRESKFEGPTLALMEVERFTNSPCGNLVPFRGVDGRTGKEFDHYAYVADPLSEEPQLSSPTWHAITAAHRSLAKLDQASRQIPRPQLLLSPTLRREAQSTSALEGTYAPLEDVLAADSVADESRSHELQEILNYVEAATGAFSWISDHPKVSLGLLEQCHKILVRGTEADTADAGRIRETPVVIGSMTGSVETARFVPMPPGSGLHSAVGSLIDWIADTNVPRDPLVAAGMAHYQFETLHPFNDGNGRIGRLMVVLQLMIAGLVSQPLLSVSPWFEVRRNEYQDHLAEVSAAGNWDDWIRFFAQGVDASAVDTASRVDRMLAIQQRFVEIVQQSAVRGGVIRDIAEILIGSPWVTVPQLADQFGRTQQAINTAVLKLVDLRILQGPFGNYNRQFVARDVIDALVAPMGDVPGVDEPLRRDRAARA